MARGLTQEQVSAASGLHPTYISDIERGARNPSWEAITRLAEGIGVGTADIAGQYDAQPPGRAMPGGPTRPEAGREPRTPSIERRAGRSAA